MASGDAIRFSFLENHAPDRYTITQRFVKASRYQMRTVRNPTSLHGLVGERDAYVLLKSNLFLTSLIEQPSTNIAGPTVKLNVAQRTTWA
ncbi:hypothetical protein SB778_28255 [Paraburkholderia sp. SIMBA_050]|jgi:hypothetical protein